MNMFINHKTEYKFTYVKVFKSLLRDAHELGISTDAVYLYSLICDRVSLSLKSHWIDDQGRIYIVFSRAEAAKTMGWSRRKTIDTFRELLVAGLIEEKARTNRAGCTVAPYIYVKRWGEIMVVRSAADIRSGCLEYYTPRNAEICPADYYELPTCLDSSLSVRAKLLYTVALDRVHLSIDFGRIDAEGRAWCELHAEEMQELLQCGHSALAAAYKELEATELLHRERHECGCVARTYLRPCWKVAEEQGAAQNVQANCLRNVPQYEEEMYGNCPENTPQSTGICTQPAFAYSALPTSPHGASICACAQDADSVRKELREELDCTRIGMDMRILLPTCDMPRVEEITRIALSVIEEDLELKQRRVCVGGEYVEKDCVVENYSRIDRYIFETLLCKLLPVWHTLTRPVPYLRKSLYRAYEDHADEAFYTRARIEEERVC